MHGAVHDYVVLKTVKDGETYPSAEEMYGGPVKDYVKYKYTNLTEQPTFEKVLEIGSLDICGSQKIYKFIDRGPLYTDLIGCKSYIGLDLIPGRCVDVVGNAHDIQFPDESFDMVLCMNMVEHDSDPAKTIKEAYRVLKTGQPFILTTVNETHAPHPQLGGGDVETYNLITKKQFTKWLHDAGFVTAEVIEDYINLFAYAIKEKK